MSIKAGKSTAGHAEGMHLRRSDIRIHMHFFGFVLELPSGPIVNGVPLLRYTSSLDDALYLLDRLLPDAEAVIMRGPLQDTVRIDPVDGGGAEISRPAGAMAGAISELAVEIAIARIEGRSPDADCPGYHDLVRGPETDPTPATP